MKPRINNRSVTIGKYGHERKSEVYLEKLSKIRDVLKKSSSKGEDALGRIKEIMEEIEEDLPPIEEERPLQEKLETVSSNPVIKVPSSKKKEMASEKKKK